MDPRILAAFSYVPCPCRLHTPSCPRLSDIMNSGVHSPQPILGVWRNTPGAQASASRASF